MFQAYIAQALDTSDPDIKTSGLQDAVEAIDFDAISLLDQTNNTRVGYFELTDGDLEFATQQGVDPEVRDHVVLDAAMQAYAQPLDSDLTAIAALSTTAYGRSLLVLANQAALQAAVGATGGTWGSITGTLSSQTDLQTALDAKLASTFTKAQLDTAISDGNGVYVGDALNGSLGTTTPSTVVSTGITVTPSANGQSVIRFNRADGTRNGSFGSLIGAPDYTAMWFGAATPSNSNYTIHTDSANGNLRINSVGTAIGFNVSGNQVAILSTAGNFTANGIVTGTLGIKAGTGATVLNILSATATLDFGSIAADSYADLTITVTGASVGDTVAIGFPNGSILADLVWCAWVSATNTVTIRVANNSSTTARDPASGTFRATVTQV